MVIDAAEATSADLEGDQAKTYDAARLHGKVRVIEPHDHGIVNGSVQLLAWQVTGSSYFAVQNTAIRDAEIRISVCTNQNRIT